MTKLTSQTSCSVRLKGYLEPYGESAVDWRRTWPAGPLSEALSKLAWPRDSVKAQENDKDPENAKILFPHRRTHVPPGIATKTGPIVATLAT